MLGNRGRRSVGGGATGAGACRWYLRSLKTALNALKTIGDGTMAPAFSLATWRCKWCGPCSTTYMHHPQPSATRTTHASEIVPDPWLLHRLRPEWASLNFVQPDIHASASRSNHAPGGSQRLGLQPSIRLQPSNQRFALAAAPATFKQTTTAKGQWPWEAMGLCCHVD
jgi:hypothetical protein